jgi:FAD binding domain
MASSMPSWAALQAGIAGEVVLPGSPAYQALPKPFNARFDEVRPQAVVRCATPQDVAETISFARRHGLACATRSGGHCFAGRSVTPGLVIDVTPMASVSVWGDLATVGAGARLSEVYESLQQRGLAIPARTKRGIDEVLAFFAALDSVGFKAETLLLQAGDDYVVDIHRGYSTGGDGKVDTTGRSSGTWTPPARSTTSSTSPATSTRWTRSPGRTSRSSRYRSGL